MVLTLNDSFFDPRSPMMMTTTATKILPQPETKHPGFGKLKTQSGVYRCLLKCVRKKKDPGHADFQGVLFLQNCACQLFVWVHPDDSLGLRLEKMTPEQLARIRGKSAAS